MSSISENSVASVHYTGTFPENDEVFDTSVGRDPLSFLVGHGQMIPGFEREIMGAAVGEKREFTLEAKDAYGESSDENIHALARDQFPEEMELDLGMELVADMGGMPVPFRVVGVSDAEVKCDFNHPMAGRALHFVVEVTDVRDATEEELAHGHAHGPGGHHHHHEHDGDCCGPEDAEKADCSDCDDKDCC